MHSLFIFLFKSLNFSHLFSRFSLEPAHCLRVILLRFQTIYCRYQHLHDTSKYSAGRVPFHIASQSFRSQQGQTHLRWWLEIYKVIPRLSFLRYFLVSCHFESQAVCRQLARAGNKLQGQITFLSRQSIAFQCLPSNSQFLQQQILLEFILSILLFWPLLLPRRLLDVK